MALPFAIMHAVTVFRRSERSRETPAAPAVRACASLALATGSGTWKWKLPVGAVAVLVVLGFIFLPAGPLIVRFADLAAAEHLSR